MLGKALEYTAQKAFKAAVVEVHHIRIVEPAGFLNLNIYSAFARHCTASSRTMRMAARGATPCVIRSSTAGGVNRLSCSQLPPNTLGSVSYTHLTLPTICSV